MKVKCKVSHEQITKTGFRMFETGREYDLEAFEEKYFESLEIKQAGNQTSRPAGKLNKGGIENGSD